MNPMIDLHGRRVGRLTILEMLQGPIRHGGDRRWLCRCDCGGYKAVRHDLLVNGLARSCGCLRRENARRMLEKCRGICAENTAAKLDTLLEQVTRYPRPAREIFRDYLDSLGSCNERTFWRALRILRERGDIERVGTPQSSGGYDASMYVRARRRAE